MPSDVPGCHLQAAVEDSTLGVLRIEGATGDQGPAFLVSCQLHGWVAFGDRDYFGKGHMAFIMK